MRKVNQAFPEDWSSWFKKYCLQHKIRTSTICGGRPSLPVPSFHHNIGEQFFFPTSLCGVLAFGSVPPASSASSSASPFSHTIFHTPSLSHTIFRTPCCHTPSFTHNLSNKPLSHTIFVTPHLCHTSLSHTIFVTHHLCHIPSLSHHL